MSSVRGAFEEFVLSSDGRQLAAEMRRIRVRSWSIRENAVAIQTQALVAEVSSRKLVDSAREAIQRSYELLEQVRREPESTARGTAVILERLQSHQVAGTPSRRR